MELRKQAVGDFRDLMDLPVVAEGSRRQILKYTQEMNLTFVTKKDYMQNGYWRDTEGNCYYVM